LFGGYHLQSLTDIINMPCFVVIWPTKAKTLTLVQGYLRHCLPQLVIHWPSDIMTEYHHRSISAERKCYIYSLRDEASIGQYTLLPMRRDMCKRACICVRAHVFVFPLFVKEYSLIIFYILRKIHVNTYTHACTHTHAHTYTHTHTHKHTR